MFYFLPTHKPLLTFMNIASYVGHLLGQIPCLHLGLLTRETLIYTNICTDVKQRNDVNKTKQNLREATRDAGKRRTASKKTEDKPLIKKTTCAEHCRRKRKTNKIK